MKNKKCKICKNPFHPERQLQQVCSALCACEYGNIHLAKKKLEVKKEARKALREFKKNDKPVLLQLAQKLVNQYIRLRDKGKFCISCNHDFSKGRQEHAGHYIPRSKSSLLRFNERNINTQCNICNDHLSGNVGEYRLGLIQKVGIEQVEFLEANKTALKTWTVEELQEVIKTYREKIKVAKHLDQDESELVIVEIKEM